MIWWSQQSTYKWTPWWYAAYTMNVASWLKSALFPFGIYVKLLMWKALSWVMRAVAAYQFSFPYMIFSLLLYVGASISSFLSFFVFVFLSFPYHFNIRRLRFEGIVLVVYILWWWLFVWNVLVCLFTCLSSVYQSSTIQT